MLRIKKLDIFIAKSFLQPFVATFFVSLLVLLLQFLWKYIEDLAGKGLEWYVILEFMVYSTANLIPLALPLAVLLASIMTFGNLGERYELTVIKSAGIPLRRVFTPLFFIILILSVFALWFSVKVIPVANLKWGALYYDVMNKKPTFSLEPGVFYNDLKDYSIKVGWKGPEGSEVKDIIIYDHSEGRGNTTVIVAESGNITYSEDERYLFFTLYRGKRYQEMVNQPEFYKKQQFSVMQFQKQRVVFDLSEFSMQRSDADMFKDFWKYRQLDELKDGMDSLKERIYLEKVKLDYIFRKNYYLDVKPMLQSGDSITAANFDFDTLFQKKRKYLIQQALSQGRTINGQINHTVDEIRPVRYLLAKYELVWWQKFTLSAACLVLFFIGAPLGAIVRKGGFGMPVLFAIFFFIAFYMLNIVVEKMVRELVVSSEFGMWLSAMILSPIGIWLTYKATSDSTLFDVDAYLRFFKRLIPKRRSKEA